MKLNLNGRELAVLREADAMHPHGLLTDIFTVRERRSLVDRGALRHAPGNRWLITDAGRKLLSQHDAPRKVTA